jgi:hypothetical protein
MIRRQFRLHQTTPGVPIGGILGYDPGVKLRRVLVPCGEKLLLRVGERCGQSIGH